MNELVFVADDGNMKISGRKLHEFLEVTTRYNDWFPRMCEYGFTEDQDFYSKMSKTSESGGRPSIDHDMTISMAKEICMIQRTDKGKEARQYFIQIEKNWNSPEMVMARALKMANSKVEQLKSEVKLLKEKADYTERILQNKGLVTMTQIAKDYGMSGEMMNARLHHLKVQYKQSGQWLLYAKYQNKGYVHSETIDFKHKDGRPDVMMHTKWTQKGRLFLYYLLKNNNIVPIIERDEKSA
ncbi:phage antirepressor KilAC domain-containing protein [Pectinatus frisingensis]|uniref:phage antirepressor KilAC domain-containing protein n=1 Tax=Pectinatus frisingensis TaxID=865 RepID=UPI0018C58BA6|nr:phage antirepressor KilAC domain-containing protein [Pectinatus frisingensis]